MVEDGTVSVEEDEEDSELELFCDNVKVAVIGGVANIGVEPFLAGIILTELAVPLLSTSANKEKLIGLFEQVVQSIRETDEEYLKQDAQSVMDIYMSAVHQDRGLLN